MSYDLGATVALGVTVLDSAGSRINAADIDLTLTLPDGTTAAPTVANPPATTGEYGSDYETTQAGRYVVRWVTTSPDTTFVDVFYVRPADPHMLVSLADVKNHLNIKPEVTTHDEELRDAIEVASEVAEFYAGDIARKTVTETHSGRGGCALVLRRQPVLSITEVTENGVTVDPSGYSLSDGGVLYRVSGFSDVPWPCGRNNIGVTYQAGTAVPPAKVLDAVKELVRINFRPQLGGNYSGFDSGAEAGGGGEVRFGFFVSNRIITSLQLGSPVVGVIG